MKLKPINEQVVVITGASSGIGRAAALDFGKLGAKVVAAARDELGLQSLVEENRLAAVGARRFSKSATSPISIR